MSLEITIGDLIANHKQTIIDKAIDKIAGRLAKQCWDDAKAMYEKQLKVEIDALVASKIGELQNIQLKETDCYGTPRAGAKPLTIVEIIAQRSEKWLSEMVNPDGRTDYGSKDRTRAQYLAQKAAEELIKGQLDPVIQKAKKDFHDAISGRLSAVFRDTLNAAIKSV